MTVIEINIFFNLLNKFVYRNRYWFTWFLVYSKPKTILLH